MPVRVGVGFQRVTALVELFVGSAALTALMVMVFGAGRLGGAVYLPVESMVPREAEPAEMSLTDQVTEVLEFPVTVALKVSEAPARMLAVGGATVTETVGGGGGGCFCVDEEVEPHPTSIKVRPRSRRMCRNEIASPRIQIKIVAGEGRRNNWPVVQKMGGADVIERSVSFALESGFT